MNDYDIDEFFLAIDVLYVIEGAISKVGEGLFGAAKAVCDNR